MKEHILRIRNPHRVYGIGTTGAAAMIAALVLLMGQHYVYFDRNSLPDIEPFVRFEFPAIGHVYDTNGQPLIELAREHRQIMQYGDIPPIDGNAILAAEDKNFFSHGGVDYSRIPRVLSKVRVGTLVTRLTRLGRQDDADSLVMWRQGGSTISQQLVRAYFLRNLTDGENSNELRPGALSFPGTKPLDLGPPAPRVPPRAQPRTRSFVSGLSRR